MLEHSDRKLTMPAAVFNKTPNRERSTEMLGSNRLMAVCTPIRHAGSPSLGSSRKRSLFDDKENSKAITNSKMGLGDVCLNHQQKDACYEVIGEEEKYCQKCAIFLASQGFKVRKLVLSSINLRDRKGHLDKMYKQVDETLRLLGTKKVETTQCQIHCTQTFQEQIQITEAYFLEFHKVVQHYRQQTLQCIQHQFNQSQRIQTQLQEVLQDCINESNSVKYRLSPKDPGSVCDLDEGRFHTVMELFKLRLNHYKNTARSWKAEEVVIKPINLCDMGHITSVLGEMFNQNMVMPEQQEGEQRGEDQDDGVIPQEETLSEDQIQQ